MALLGGVVSADSPVTPSVDGKDIKPLEEMEADNEQRLARLQAIGFSEDVLNLVALQVRVEAIASTFPPALRVAMERRYEAMLGGYFDEMYAEATRPRLVAPTQAASTLVVPE